MALSRKPAIAEKRIGDRATVFEIGNIRQRIEAIETLVDAVALQAGQSSFTLTRSNATVNNFQSQITQIANGLDSLLSMLTLDDGLVVAAGGDLITRRLEAGTNITIDNPDGVDGDPVINASGGGYPFLTTEPDDDILTEDGHRIRTE